MADQEVNENLGQAEGYEEPLVVTIQRLADMAPVEYERIRKDEAKRLNMRASVLDREVAAARKNGKAEDDLGLFEPEPWPEEVDGDDLLDRIMGGLRRHVVMPAHAAEAVALWVVHCHVFEVWQHTPRLAVGAPEKGCGKSTLLDVAECLVPRALKTESLSAASAFRAIEHFRPVIMADEYDTYLSGKNADEALRGILNSGYAKNGKVLRCEGDNNVVKAFRTFAPVALAGIGSLPPTLADRSIAITLQKRRADEYVQNFRSDQAGHLHELASQTARWVKDNKTVLHNTDPAMPEGLYNRRADVWRPLLAIADVAGGNWPERARQAAIALTGNAADDGESIRIQLLGDIRAAFERHGDDRLSSSKLAEYLHDMEDRPWPEYGRTRKPISTNQIARLLKAFGIRPGTIRYDTGTAKGYRLGTFKEAFARYISENPTVTTSQPPENCEKSGIPNRNIGENVTVENPPNPAESLACDVVTDENGGYGETTLFEGDPEEREAIQAIDGEAAFCIHCGELVGLDEKPVPVAGGRVLHGKCYDAHFKLDGRNTLNDPEGSTP